MEIDWANMPTYNTIMAVATGAALLSLANAGRRLRLKQFEKPFGWGINFLILGLILFATGLHMTLTWPLKDFPYDNIVFGEPALALGTIMLGLAYYCLKWKGVTVKRNNLFNEVLKELSPLKYLMFGLGFSLIFIGIAGITNQLFVAPPEEPLTGYFSKFPWVEIIFISVLWILTGVAAIVTGLILNKAQNNQKIPFLWRALYYWILRITGIIFLLFGALNFFTHISLIVSTMPK